MNILIIEDYPSVAQITKNTLISADHLCELKTSTEFNRYTTDFETFNLLIIDINLRNKITLEIIKWIRDSKIDILILGLASKSTWKEKVEFLNKGGDDVIDYPFAIQELLARISSLARRPKRLEEKILRIKDLQIDTDMKNVTRKNKEIPLRRREYTLLEYLVKNRNRTLTRSELLDKVWDYRRITSSNTVDVHIKRLRDKLHDKEIIKTVHGFGYSINEKP